MTTAADLIEDLRDYVNEHVQTFGPQFETTDCTLSPQEILDWLDEHAQPASEDKSESEGAVALAADLSVVAGLNSRMLILVAEWMLDHGWTEPLT